MHNNIHTRTYAHLENKTISILLSQHPHYNYSISAHKEVQTVTCTGLIEDEDDWL